MNTVKEKAEIKKRKEDEPNTREFHLSLENITSALSLFFKANFLSNILKLASTIVPYGVILGTFSWPNRAHTWQGCRA